MRHRMDGRKFDRSGSSRLAMFRNLLANLVTHEKITTTEAKAKELRRVAEKLVTKARTVGKSAGKAVRMTKKQKLEKLSVYRELRWWLPMEAYDTQGVGINLAAKLIDEIAPRYAQTPGGYTRIFKIGRRRGDGAPMSVIQFVPVAAMEEKPKEEKKKTRKSLFASKSKKESA